MRVKAGVALPAQPAAIETLVDGGVLTLSSTSVFSDPFFLISPGASVVYEVVAEAKTIPPSESLRFRFSTIEW